MVTLSSCSIPAVLDVSSIITRNMSVSIFLYKYQAEIMQGVIRSTMEKVLFHHGVVFVPPRWNENFSMMERDSFYFLKSSFRLTVLLLISGCAQKPMNVM